MRKRIILLSLCMLQLSATAQIVWTSAPTPFLGDKYISIGAGFSIANPSVTFYSTNPEDVWGGNIETPIESFSANNNMVFSFRFDGLQNIGEYCAGGPIFALSYLKEGWQASIDGNDLVTYDYSRQGYFRYPGRIYDVAYSGAKVNVEVGFNFGVCLLDERLYVGAQGFLYVTPHFNDTLVFISRAKADGSVRSTDKKDPEEFACDFGLGFGLSASYLITDNLFVSAHVGYQALPIFSSSNFDEYSYPTFCNGDLKVAYGYHHDINALFTIGYRFEGIR